MIKHLLLIDDNAIVCKVNTLLAQKAGLSERTTSLSNGLEGIEYLEEVCTVGQGAFPDLIFLDIQMPVMDGFEFLEIYSGRFAREFPNTKIVMITGSVEPTDIVRAYSYSFVIAYLQKPLQLEELENLKNNRHLYVLYQGQETTPTPGGATYNLKASEGAVSHQLPESSKSF